MNSGLPCSQIRLAILFDATTFGWCGTCYDIMNGLVKTDHIGPNSRKGRHLCCEHHMSICGGVLEFCGYGGYPKEKKKESPSTQSWLPIQTPLGIQSTSLWLSKKLLQLKSFTIYSKVCYVENLTYYENGRWEKLLEPSSLHQHINFLTNPSSTSRCSFCTSKFITIYQYGQSNLITFAIGIWRSWWVP